MHDFPAEGFFFLTPFFKKTGCFFGSFVASVPWIFWILLFLLEEELSLAHVFEVQRITSNCETCHDRFFCFTVTSFFVFFVRFAFGVC